MSAALSPVFAEVLRACREEINARFALMRREFADLDAESYFAFLRTGGDAVVRAVNPSAAVETGRTVCEAALELVARNLAGPKARHRWLEEAWQRVLPANARITGEEPRRVIGAVSNAVTQIAATHGARPGLWIALMEKAAPLAADADALLRAGQVAAWRSGLAHFRNGALAAAGELPAPLMLAALGSEGDAKLLLERLRSDAWYDPAALENGARLVARAGAFRGFGGVFPLPPVISLHQGQWIATSGDEQWLLAADAFGATFHRITAGNFAPTRSARSLPRGVVVPSDCGEVTGVAAQGATTAVTASLTHAVLFFHTP